MSQVRPTMADRRADALAEANRVKTIRFAIREELRSGGPAELIAAIIEPTPEFATFKLQHIFATDSPGGGVIPRFGRIKLNRALNRFNQTGGSYRAIHASHRLKDLSERERRGLVKYIVAGAPRAWRQRKEAELIA